MFQFLDPTGLSWPEDPVGESADLELEVLKVDLHTRLALAGVPMLVGQEGGVWKLGRVEGKELTDLACEPIDPQDERLMRNARLASAFDCRPRPVLVPIAAVEEFERLRKENDVDEWVKDLSLSGSIGARGSIAQHEWMLEARISELSSKGPGRNLGVPMQKAALALALEKRRPEDLEATEVRKIIADSYEKHGTAKERRNIKKDDVSRVRELAREALGPDGCPGDVESW